MNAFKEPTDPTESCPECSRFGLLRERCECVYRCSECAAGHRWHTCPEHLVQVEGSGHARAPAQCTCPSILDMLAKILDESE